MSIPQPAFNGQQLSETSHDPALRNVDEAGWWRNCDGALRELTVLTAGSKNGSTLPPTSSPKPSGAVVPTAQSKYSSSVYSELSERFAVGALFLYHPVDGNAVRLCRTLQRYIVEATDRAVVEYQPLAGYLQARPWRWFAGTELRSKQAGGFSAATTLGRLELIVNDHPYSRYKQSRLTPVGCTTTEPSRLEQWLYTQPRMLSAVKWYTLFVHTILLCLLGVVSASATIHSYNARDEKFGAVARNPLIASLVFAAAVVCCLALQLGYILFRLYRHRSLNHHAREAIYLPVSLLNTGTVLALQCLHIGQTEGTQPGIRC